MTQAIAEAMRQAVAEGVFPAAELLVAKDEEIRFHDYFGAARPGTCFDIASLTKPICTATLTALFIAEELLKPDDTLAHWLCQAQMPEHRAITIEMLLNHTSGLPAWQPYYRELPLSLIGTDEAKQLVIEEGLRELLATQPGEATLYSDIGYILLGAILEEAGDGALDSLFLNLIARPLDLHDTFFARSLGMAVDPVSSEAAKRQGNRRFAPTEDCPWRKRVLHGEVHDQNAYALGGVAGHAGLFSTAADLHRFLLSFIGCYEGKGDWIPTSVLRRLIDFSRAPQRDHEVFLGGWNLPSLRHSAAGHLFSKQSIGHLAYTGCSIWADLERRAWVILLTNRVHPSNTNEKIKAWRPQIHDLIMKELVVS